MGGQGTVSDEALARISECAARYFCGWSPKPFGKRRFPAFEAKVVAAVLEYPVPSKQGNGGG